MGLINWKRDFHLERSHQIARVLFSHGWAYLTNNGFQRHVGSAIEKVGKTKPEHLRLALEELGTTFIKLGQILSTRADLLPPEYLAELTKLQDATSPIPFESVRDVVVSELGRPIEQLFAEFDSNPLAAASIGQAHLARLPDGTEVVVKIRRPGVVEQVREDLEILKELAATARRHWEFADRYDVVGLVDEFSQTLLSELDYIRESHNVERFAENFTGNSLVHIPKVFWETTTSRVLTLERVKGVKINDLQGLHALHIDRHHLAENATSIVLKMVCEDGFFHADPHPGNFFVESDGTLGLIDFGMVGILDSHTQDRLADLLIAIDQRDAEALVDVLLDLGVTRKRVERAQLRRDIERLLTTYWGVPLQELKVTALLNDAFAVMRQNRLHLPPNLALLLKTVIMIEGLGVNLDPQFHLTKALAPYAEKLVVRKYSPLRWIRTLSRAGFDLARLGAEMPQQLRRIAAAAQDGNFEIGMRPEGFDPIVDRLERIANRIVLGVIAAAFINGLAILVSVYSPPGWDDWAWIVFLFGFACALLLGIYLASSILRSKHHRR